MSPFARRLGAALAATLLAAFAGCASLPDFHALYRNAEAETPRLVGARRILSPAQSAAILERLKAKGGGSEILDRHLAFMEAIGGPPLVAGNEARLLIDGPATYAAMFAAIQAARERILVETYILRDDRIGHELAERLVEKRRQGVEVALIYDAVGTLLTPNAFFDRLGEQGIGLCQFNPINPLRGAPGNPNHRDHRKILVVDGKVAFTGGINFDSVYGSSSRIRKRVREPVHEGWRDTQVEIRGPAAAEFERLFRDTWAKQDCGPLAGQPTTAPAQGDKIVRVIGSSPDDRDSLIYLALLSAITHAERSIHITMAYFVPDVQMLDALKTAARRGVDVQLVLPGLTDFWIVLAAGRSHYGELLDAGVKIYERRDAMVHAKTAVIDGVWSTVGSANMDLRSFLHNDEVNAVVLSTEFGQQMERMFGRDRAESVPIDAAAWAQRPLAARFKEGFARLWAYWL